MTIDLKDYYLNTPMSRYEYFRMKINLFPQDIINEFKLQDIVDANGKIFCEVQRGMYGLPQAGLLPKNSSKNASRLPDTAKANSHLVSGHTHGAQSGSALWLMILA
jgi:hypothetical protein